MTSLLEAVCRSMYILANAVSKTEMETFRLKKRRRLIGMSCSLGPNPVSQRRWFLTKMF